MQQEPLHIDWERFIDLLEKPAAEREALIAAMPAEEQALFVRFRQLHDDELLTGALQLNTAQAWKKTVTPVRSIGWKRWVAAACILLAIGGGWLAWEQLHDAAAGHGYQGIAQGLAGHLPSDKVKLVTADGRTVEVDSTKELKEKDGTIIQMQQGSLAYQKDRDNISTAPANALLMNTLLVPRGYMYSLVLSDGSKVWLNADSKISFPVQFDKSERKVTIEGEAYFEVAHNEKWPFTVNVHNTQVKVLGTSFDVKAYGGNIYTTLVTGRVSFAPHPANAVQLTPGEQAVYRAGRGDAIETRKIIAGDWIAWKDDDLVMVKMSLAELAEILERRYDVQVSFADEKLKEIQYNAAIHLSGNIIDLLNNLEQTGNIHFAVKDKKIVILPANIK